MCSTGRQNLCENLQFFGCGWEQGGMADRFTVAANRLHAIPDDLDDLDDTTAALIEPLSTPVHAVRLAGNGFGAAGLAGVTGKSVAVIGAGSIGLLVVAVLKAYAARRVVVTDMIGAKRAKAIEPTPPSTPPRPTSSIRYATRSAKAPMSSSTASRSSPPSAKQSASPARAERLSLWASHPPTSAFPWQSCRTTRYASRAAPPTCPRTTANRSPSYSTAPSARSTSSPPPDPSSRSPKHSSSRPPARTSRYSSP